MLVAIVPAFNEEKSVGSVVRSLFNHVDKVIVVDDGSVDQTAKVAEEAGAVVLRHELNRGQGAALQTGHELAKKYQAEYVLHFDADGQFEVMDIRPALEALVRSKADLLFGSRFLGKSSHIPFLKRYFIFPVAKLINHLFSGLKLDEIHNGFRILNNKALHKIEISQDRMAHATEIQAQVKKYGLKFIEFPVKVVYHKFGQGISSGVKVLFDLIFQKFFS